MVPTKRNQTKIKTQNLPYEENRKGSSLDFPIPASSARAQVSTSLLQNSGGSNRHLAEQTVLRIEYQGCIKHFLGFFAPAVCRSCTSVAKRPTVACQTDIVHSDDSRIECDTFAFSNAYCTINCQDKDKCESIFITDDTKTTRGHQFTSLVKLQAFDRHCCHVYLVCGRCWKLCRIQFSLS
jgi:hypothetical protein